MAVLLEIGSANLDGRVPGSGASEFRQHALETRNLLPSERVRRRDGGALRIDGQIAPLPADPLEHVLPSGIVLQPGEAKVLLIDPPTAPVESDETQGAKTSTDLPVEVPPKMRIVHLDEGWYTGLAGNQNDELRVASKMPGQHPNETSDHPRFDHVH